MNSHPLSISLSQFPESLPEGLYPQFEFHIHANLRKKYHVDESLFSVNGNVIFPNYHAVRILAHAMNAGRDLNHHPELTVHSGQLNAMGLIDEIYHYILRLYEETANPKVFQRAVQQLHTTISPDEAKQTMDQFGTLFPPTAVYQGTQTIHQYLASSTSGKSNIEITIEEMILLYFANFNPAFAPFHELFDEKDLKERTAYARSITELELFFQNEKRFGPHHQFIFDLLRAPILASPNSLAGQLAYIRKHWGLILSDKFTQRMLGADDLMKEDARSIAHGGPGTPPVPSYQKHDSKGVGLLDLERFTSDLDWMPNVVLLAKNTYVWLAQLSQQYKRPIKTLTDIPDEELDRLARWNITSLWLIGIWERSPASQNIKQWTGNPEAVSSAYSLFDYTIANDLGGEDAFQNLRYRAGQRGIRLAGDMVPNHMGIFSKWIVEHPDYFIQSPHSPYPNYQFTGGNLSNQDGIEIRIENGYWNRTDAAVVFQRVDTRNNDVRYIYHGNDGTHMPWNDTAQLNFLRAEVREAVIQTIFHVARKFSIIRFDAAMTLTKRHFQRLWFPQPGSGGDIPSRADHALATEEFNKLFPHEFWREVVDRINQEMPETLLLAEAFWLLEGYFVRTLGMHRVYNSAFMHMLMKEENSKYRELIRNTMQYNPEILKRYVNFMSNPDEQTAIAQFGKDDKYFGCALLMVTLPGLPMFAHGQVEGYNEKYGMEYKRAYYDEEPDQQLIRRHEEEIFPLLGKRYLFSQVQNFELYDFIDLDGNLNENVLVYSNKSGGERAIICYHNKYAETSGSIKNSVGRNIGSTDQPNLVHRTLAEALECSADDNAFYIFRDYKTNLEYIRSGKDLHTRGLHVELKAFEYHIFLDFQEVRDTTGKYVKLTKHLHGKGIADLRGELIKVKLFPVYLKLYNLLTDDTLVLFTSVVLGKVGQSGTPDTSIKLILDGYESFIEEANKTLKAQWNISVAIEHAQNSIHAMQRLFSDFRKELDKSFPAFDWDLKDTWCILFNWLIAGETEEPSDVPFFDRLRLADPIGDILGSMNLDEKSSKNIPALIRALHVPVSGEIKTSTAWEEYFNQKGVHEYIQLHSHDGIMYFNKECFEDLVDWRFFIVLIRNAETLGNKFSDSIIKAENRDRKLLEQAALDAEYQFDQFLNKLPSVLKISQGD
jgi:glycosidase